MPEEKETKEKIIPLISVYLKDGNIETSYSDENSEIIIANNLLLCGHLAKVQNELLNLEEEDEES